MRLFLTSCRVAKVLFFTLLVLLLPLSQAQGQAGAAPDDKAVSVLVLKPQCNEARHDKDAGVLANLVSARLAELPNLEVSSYADLDELAKAEDSSADCGQDCALEIAGAMGVRYVVTSLLMQRSARWHLYLALYDMEQSKILGRRDFSALRIEGLSLRIDQDLAPWIGALMMPEARAALSARSRTAAPRAKSPESQVRVRENDSIKSQKNQLKTNSYTYRSDTGSAHRTFRQAPVFGALAGASLVAALTLGLSGYWSLRLADPDADRASKDQALGLGPSVAVGGTLLTLGLAAVSAGLLVMGDAS